MKKTEFGRTLAGEQTTLYTFENAGGMKMSVTDYGATLVRVLVPGENGELLDVVLGHDEAAGYETGKGSLGATVGRNGNRIGGASFSLNGRTYSLAKNDNGANNLHSGPDYYFTRLWEIENVTESGVTFRLFSPDGDQGFPGNFDVTVTYTLTEQNEVRIEYNGKSDADTIVNMTNHSYFNLDGHGSGSILAHEVWLDADGYTRVDQELIPTGEILPVAGTPMDLRRAKRIGRDIETDCEALAFGGGYDHNWTLKNNGAFAHVATLTGAVSGIHMDVSTDLPGVQMYVGNFLDHEPGKDGVYYEKRQGVCFETQYFPDAIHHENFKSPVLKANEPYHTVTAYRFYR